MSIQLTGTLHTIFETKQLSERFTKREFVVETSDNPRYPQTVLFEITGDKVDRLDEFHVGDEVRVEFEVRGREWKSPTGEVRYFNSLNAWDLKMVKAAPRADSRGGAHAPPVTNAAVIDPDDIPF